MLDRLLGNARLNIYSIEVTLPICVYVCVSVYVYMHIHLYVYRWREIYIYGTNMPKSWALPFTHLRVWTKGNCSGQ